MDRSEYALQEGATYSVLLDVLIEGAMNGVTGIEGSDWRAGVQALAADVSGRPVRSTRTFPDYARKRHSHLENPEFYYKCDKCGSGFASGYNDAEGRPVRDHLLGCGHPGCSRVRHMSCFKATGLELELEGMEHQLIAINFAAITRAEVEKWLDWHCNRHGDTLDGVTINQFLARLHREGKTVQIANGAAAAEPEELPVYGPENTRTAANGELRLQPQDYPLGVYGNYTKMHYYERYTVRGLAPPVHAPLATVASTSELTPEGSPEPYARSPSVELAELSFAVSDGSDGSDDDMATAEENVRAYADELWEREPPSDAAGERYSKRVRYTAPLAQVDPPLCHTVRADCAAQADPPPCRTNA